MKKRSLLSLAVIGLLLAVICTPMAASAAICDHPSTRTVSSSDYTALDETHHQKRIIQKTYCTVCNALLSTTQGQLHREAHSMNLSYADSYHTGAHHVWVYRCRCGYTFSKTSVCSGPPCSTPYSAGPISAEELMPCKHPFSHANTIQTKECLRTVVRCNRCDSVLSVHEDFTKTQ